MLRELLEITVLAAGAIYILIALALIITDVHKRLTRRKERNG